MPLEIEPGIGHPTPRSAAQNPSVHRGHRLPTPPGVEARSNRPAPSERLDWPAQGLLDHWAYRLSDTLLYLAASFIKRHFGLIFIESWLLLS